MPSETSSASESTGKRKLKTKAPKRLRRKNKPAEHNVEENPPDSISAADDGSLKKDSVNSEPAPCTSHSSSSAIENNPIVLSTNDAPDWRLCAHRAMNVLEKQAFNRRQMLIERHRERVHSVRCVLYQREQINTLSNKYQSIAQSCDSLRNELRTREETLKVFEDKLHDQDELRRDNDFLRVQLRLMEQKFERFTSEYSKKLDECRQQEHESSEHIQALMDEIERLKRDLVLEEYRKQEAERRVRYCDEKLKGEQTANKKMQQDFVQLKQELKSMHARYDSLQIEMLAMHKANNNDVTLIPTRDTNDSNWPKKRSIDGENDEQLETKRSKRKTRDRTESSASATSSTSEQRRKILTKSSKDKVDSNEPSLTKKRATRKSHKATDKNHLPTVTVTHASPSVDPPIAVEKDGVQLLLPPSASATSDGSTLTSDSPDTSSESQPTNARTKKQSRYPCRRAQRPVKQPAPNHSVGVDAEVAQSYFVNYLFSSYVSHQINIKPGKMERCESTSDCDQKSLNSVSPMTHRVASSAFQLNTNFHVPVANKPSTRLSINPHVSIIEPEPDSKPAKPVKSALKTPSIFNDDFIPIDDFSSEFIYESHLGRFCKNVIVVSARHPHSFFLQTVDDLTQSDNFFSKMNEFYNRCFDAQRLVVSKAVLRANLCCVARDEIEHDVWNRAQLLEYHRETDQCSLLLVDLGTWQECVPRANLRHILVPFRNESVHSVPCRLAGIAPAKPEKNGLWNEYAIKTFRNVIDNVPTEVEVLDRSPNGSYFVNLFVTHETFVCVNDFLLYHKIAIPVDDCKVLQPKEFDPISGKPVLAIIHEFNLQGELLTEELQLQQVKQKEEQAKKDAEEQQRQSNCRLPCVRIVDVYSPSHKRLIFARFNQWMMVPWFCISGLFEPPLSESTIERFAMLYKFCPVFVNPLTNAVLCVHLQKCMPFVNYNASAASQGHETRIALYSIDCVRKLLLNHCLNNELLFERLDEAREAEMKEDEEFWQSPSSVLVETKKFDEERAQSQRARLESHQFDQLENRLERVSLVNPAYKSTQRQLSDIMEQLSGLSHDSNSSY